jgi:hypothetical protein
MPTRPRPKPTQLVGPRFFSTSRRVARAERTPPRGIFLFFVAAGPETPASARCAVCLPARVTASCTRLVLDQWFTVHACAASGFNDQIGDAMHATAFICESAGLQTENRTCAIYRSRMCLVLSPRPGCAAVALVFVFSEGCRILLSSSPFQVVNYTPSLQSLAR